VSLCRSRVGPGSVSRQAPIWHTITTTRTWSIFLIKKKNVSGRYVAKYRTTQKKKIKDSKEQIISYLFIHSIPVLNMIVTCAFSIRLTEFIQNKILLFVQFSVSLMFRICRWPELRGRLARTSWDKQKRRVNKEEEVFSCRLR
jgi:hypothetical protein